MNGKIAPKFIDVNSTRPSDTDSLLTIGEVASLLRISYDTALRHFSGLPGVLVMCRPKRYRRPYKTYKIPATVFRREWNKMADHNTGGAR